MKIVRVVLDTNVVVSAHLNGEGYERYALDLGLARKLQLCASQEVFLEYEQVLGRPKFGLDANDVALSLQLIRDASLLVRPRQKVSATLDSSDNKFLECAQATNANFLVTGNKRHFPQTWLQTKIVNARELIEFVVPEIRGR